MDDYKPPLLTEVYDRHQNKIGEFFRERRQLFAYEDMPKHLIEAFVAAEDGSFFSHKGLNYKAIFRAFLANLKAGKKIQGGSTITQQVARSLLLSSKKTYTRKFKEAVLALRMEAALSKQDILYIYLNQIYLGHGAYGVEVASKIYFQKSTKSLSLPEAALLAGLPKAPSRFSPIFYPERAKARQAYVLRRMREEGFLSEERMAAALAAPLKIYPRKDFNSQAPYFLETVRRVLLLHLSQKEILESGLRVYTALDLEKQKAAQKALKKGLEELDKRQGWRGAAKSLPDPEERAAFLAAAERKLRRDLKEHIIIPGFAAGAEGLKEFSGEEGAFSFARGGGDSPPQRESFWRRLKGRFGKDPPPAEKPAEISPPAAASRQTEKPLKLPAPPDREGPFPWEQYASKLEGKIFQAAVVRAGPEGIDVEAPWGREFLPLESFEWAVPAAEKPEKKTLSHSKEIFKPHDAISLKIKAAGAEKDPSGGNQRGPSFLEKSGLALELYQEPLAEGALLSFDLENDEVAALVGGYDFARSEFNRAYQSRRQSGSVFKPFIYGAALARGFHPASVISDSPLVFSSEEAEEKTAREKSPPPPKEPDSEDSMEEPEDWRPANISERFSGELLFRSALIRSLNVPTVRLMEQIKIPWARLYIRRLGIFSPLNPDYTMALGSSSLTLYEVLKAFSVFPKQGRRLSPVLVYRAEGRSGKAVLSEAGLDELFAEEIQAAAEMAGQEASQWISRLGSSERDALWRELLEGDSPYAIPPSNSYVMTNLLESVISDPEGTGGRARALQRPLAGKTGTTDGYYDAWFVGFSPLFSAGVWVGFDQEKTLGRGETGSRAALPIWMDYIKETHKELPPDGFPIPEGVVFANIDGETGGLVSSKTARVARQAFIEGTEPLAAKQKASEDEPRLFEPSGISPDMEADFIKEDLSRQPSPP